MKIKSFRIWALAVCLFSFLPYHALAFYNPKTGHWLSRDPIEENGGFNLFTMSNNNLIDKVDSFGLQDYILYTGIMKPSEFNLPIPANSLNQVGNPIDMGLLYFFGGGKQRTLSPQYMDIIVNSPEVINFKDSLKTSSEVLMCKTPCGQKGQYTSHLSDEDYHALSSWTGNWQLTAIGKTTWRGKSDGLGGCIVSAHESIKGFTSKNYTFALTPGGNAWNKVPTFFLLPSMAYVAGGGSYSITGDFDIEFDFTANCHCKNTSQ